MPRRATARDLEARAARVAPLPATAPPGGEVLGMLARRGFRPTPSRADLPMPDELPAETAARLVEHLRHYSFRLFLRGAIQRPGAVAPREITGFLEPAQAEEHADALVELGLARRARDGRISLVRRARSFGGLLEWYVARELRARLGLDAVAGLKFRAAGVGGDLDVVAAADGRLIYFELKSSPPKHLKPPELAAFRARVRALRPDVTLFVVDTALRLADRVLPLLGAALELAPPTERLGGEVFALTPHLYAVGAKPDLMTNVERALALGLRALAPPAP